MKRKSTPNPKEYYRATCLVVRNPMRLWKWQSKYYCYSRWCHHRMHKRTAILYRWRKVGCVRKSSPSFHSISFGCFFFHPLFTAAACNYSLLRFADDFNTISNLHKLFKHNTNFVLFIFRLGVRQSLLLFRDFILKLHTHIPNFQTNVVKKNQISKRKCLSKYFAHVNTCRSIHLLSQNSGEHFSSIAKM